MDRKERMKLKVFISSVTKEFGQARRNLKAFLLGDVVLHRFISDVFLFEELPAKDRRADEVYLEEVKRCDIYLGIFGYEYGSERSRRYSPTGTVMIMPMKLKDSAYLRLGHR